jgi:hypothetical protein
MKNRIINVETLVGRRVLARNGVSIGRIEDICARTTHRSLVVTEYHVGAFAMLERLSASVFGRAILTIFHIRKKGYGINWDQLDLSDPGSPRLTCQVSELRKLR